jgi:4-hydroxybenzoate polyprenyltransferase
LRELGWAGVGAAALQLAGSFWLRPLLAVWLLVAWVYLALMSKEFFARDWLKKRPLAYMLSHMAVMPIFDIYATACDWLAAGSPAPVGIGWFLAASYTNGIVVEIGRKVRSPDDEEAGVETYTFLWGRPKALAAWLAAMFLTAVFAWRGALLVGFAIPVAWLLAALLFAAASLALSFIRAPSAGRGKQIENFSGIWTLSMYLGLGVIPLLIRYLGY